MPKEGRVVDEDIQMRALSTICIFLEKTNYSLVMNAKDTQARNKLKSAFQDDGIYRRDAAATNVDTVREVRKHM